MFSSEKTIQTHLTDETTAERRSREHQESRAAAHRALRQAIFRNSGDDKNNPDVLAALDRLRVCTMRWQAFYEFERAYLEQDDAERHFALSAAYERICIVASPH